jgi:hypothetical protein
MRRKWARLVRGDEIRGFFVMRQDIISINRQFLVMVREMAKSPSGQAALGLPRKVMEKIANMSLEQIEELANVPVSLFTLRLTEEEIERRVRHRRARLDQDDP